jgi:beta-galactosidase
VERGAFGLGRTDTEEYAALAHEVNNREYERRPWIAGSTIWVAFDYFEGNPHEGVADEARYPKDAYYYYQSQWSAEPMLRIRSASHWNQAPAEGQARRTGLAQDVVADSNCDQMELFVNGRSQGVRPGPGPFEWRQVAYARGSIKAVCRKGSAILEHIRYTAGEPYQIALSADAYELAADGRDVAYLKTRVLDQEGRLVANLNDAIRFEATGEGELAGPQSQKLLAGVATLASVRSTTTQGTIQVTARYGRLKPATVAIRTVAGKSSVDYE